MFTKPASYSNQVEVRLTSLWVAAVQPIYSSNACPQVSLSSAFFLLCLSKRQHSDAASPVSPCEDCLASNQQITAVRATAD